MPPRAFSNLTRELLLLVFGVTEKNLAMIFCITSLARTKLTSRLRTLLENVRKTSSTVLTEYSDDPGVASGNVLDDFWNVDGDWELSKPCTGFVLLTILHENFQTDTGVGISSTLSNAAQH